VDPYFIRTKGLAALLNVSNSKAHELVMSGRVKSVWLDGVRLIPVEEARGFAEKLKTDAGLAVA
jgi:hypothetical protein